MNDYNKKNNDMAEQEKKIFELGQQLHKKQKF